MYLVPVFLPDVIWLGLAPMLFGMMQFVVHGIMTPKKLGQFYNPGLAAVVLGHIPLGIYYSISALSKQSRWKLLQQLVNKGKCKSLHRRKWVPKHTLITRKRLILIQMRGGQVKRLTDLAA
nr:HXXEE domain-containing protein [Neobacillus rhizosphaerae]